MHPMLCWYRSWMLTVADDSRRFVTARQRPPLLLVQPSVDGDRLCFDAPGMQPLSIPVEPDLSTLARQQIKYGDRCMRHSQWRVCREGQRAAFAPGRSSRGMAREGKGVEREVGKGWQDPQISKHGHAYAEERWTSSWPKHFWLKIHKIEYDKVCWMSQKQPTATKLLLFRLPTCLGISCSIV